MGKIYRVNPGRGCEKRPKLGRINRINSNRIYRINRIYKFCLRGREFIVFDAKKFWRSQLEGTRVYRL